MNTSAERRRDFSAWLRTGRWPRHGNGRGLEFKFNPYHDPANGQFTTAAGSGGAVGFTPATPRGHPGSKVVYVSDSDKAPIATMAEADAWRARELAEHGGDPEYAAAIEARYQEYVDAFSRSRVADPSLGRETPSPDQRSASSDSLASNAPHGNGGNNDGDSVGDRQSLKMVGAAGDLQVVVAAPPAVAERHRPSPGAMTRQTGGRCRMPPPQSPTGNHLPRRQRRASASASRRRCIVSFATAMNIASMTRAERAGCQAY